MKKEQSSLVKYFKKFVLDERKNLFNTKIQERTKYITIVLENIFQGRNISASIRSADCFGIQDVHVIENDNIFNNDPEVSMGAEKWITTKRHNTYKENSTRAIKYLRNKGYKIIATTPHNADSNLYDLDIKKGKIALFFGSEVNGCSKETLKLSDQKIRIPMYGFTESYNISVAVSLSLQHLTYKMRKSNVDWKLKKNQQERVMLQWLRNSIKSSKKIEEQFLDRFNKK